MAFRRVISVYALCGGARAAWTSPWELLEFAGTGTPLSGFYGGFASGAWGYLLPGYSGYVVTSRVARFDLETLDGVQVLDPAGTDPELKGFVGGFEAAGWGYLVPFRNGLDSHFGKVARFDLQAFSNVEVLDLTSTDPALKGFFGGFASDRWGFLVPCKDGKNHVGKVARFDLETCRVVQTLDLPLVDPALVGFGGGFAAGDWGYLVPGASNKFARFHLESFADVQVMEFTSLNATDADLPKFVGAFHDGIWGYGVPSHSRSSKPSGKVTRFSLQTFADIQLLDLQLTDLGLVSFTHGFSAGPWGYVVQMNTGRPARFDLDSFSIVQSLNLAITGGLGLASGFSVGAWAYFMAHDAAVAARVGIPTTTMTSSTTTLTKTGTRTATRTTTLTSTTDTTMTTSKSTTTAIAVTSMTSPASASSMTTLAADGGAAMPPQEQSCCTKVPASFAKQHRVVRCPPRH